MKHSNSPRLTTPSILLLSFLGTGFAPFAPGTVGSLATLPIIYLLGYFSVPVAVVVSLLIPVTVFTCIITHRVQVKYSVHDPSWIVIDEVLGMILTWCFFPSIDPLHLAICFGAFRFFDIIKFQPAKWFDQQNFGAATILDDIISAIYAGIVYRLIIMFMHSA